MFYVAACIFKKSCDNPNMKLGRKWRHFDELLSELLLDLSQDRNMISDFGFQEHIQLLKLDVLMGTDFCQTRTTLCYFVKKINYGRFLL